MYKRSTACSHHASYVKTKSGQTTPSSFCGRMAMQSEGRQQHMEPFRPSYSMRLYRHAQWLNSYTIFCYHVLYFHPLSPRFSKKNWSLFCRTKSLSVWIQSEIFLNSVSIYFFFHVIKYRRRYKTTWCPLFYASNRSLQEYSETVFRIITWLLPSIFFPLTTMNHPNIPEYRVYTLRHTDYVWARNSTFRNTQITSELQSLLSETHRLRLSYRVYTLRHID